MNWRRDDADFDGSDSPITTTYCLSKTAIPVIAPPVFPVPVVVVLHVLPSCDTTPVPTATSFPPLKRLQIMVLASTRV